MRRRSYVVGVGTATAAVLAGCLSGNADEPGDDDSEADGTADLDPEAAVERMLEVDDVDSLAEAVHSESPIHPDAFESDGLGDLEELTPEEQAAVAEAMRGPEPPDPNELKEITGDDWEYEIDEDQPDVELDGVDVLTDSATADDVLELEHAEFWFAETDLDSIIEENHVFIVEVDIAYPEQDSGPDPSLDEPTVWVLVSEGDELKFFYAGEEDTTPEDPEELYEEEIIDEDDDVVEEIEWEPEPIGPVDDDGDDDEQNDAFEELEEARVHLTDSPGIEAEVIHAESVVAGGEISVWEPEDMEADDTGYVPGGWADSWVAVQYDPDGDQIVVTAITGDEEEIVHRETYEP